MQSWEPSDLRGFFLLGPTAVMGSSLPRTSVPVSLSSVQPLWKLMSEEADSSLHCFLSISLSAFTVSPSIPLFSLSFLTCLRLSETDCNNYHAQDLFLSAWRFSLLSAFNLFPGVKETLDWCLCFLLSPMLPHLGKAELQMQMGSCKLELIQKSSFHSLFNSWMNVDSLTLCRHRSTWVCSILIPSFPLPCPASTTIPCGVRLARMTG